MPPVFVFSPILENYRQVLADNSFVQYTPNSTIVAAGALGLLLGIHSSGRMCRAAACRQGQIARILEAYRLASLHP